MGVVVHSHSTNAMHRTRAARPSVKISNGAGSCCVPMKNMYARPAAMLYMKQSRLCSTVLMNAINAVIDMKRVESGMNTRPNMQPAPIKIAE